MSAGPNLYNAKRAQRRKAWKRSATSAKAAVLESLDLGRLHLFLEIAPPKSDEPFNPWGLAPSNFAGKIEGGLLSLLGIDQSPSTPAAVDDDMAPAGVVDTQDGDDVVHGMRVASGSLMPGEYAPSKAEEFYGLSIVKTDASRCRAESKPLLSGQSLRGTHEAA